MYLGATVAVTMALQNILQGLQRLSLTTGSNISSQLSHLVTTRSFHTTGICCRVMNRRMYPVSREPSSKGRWEERKPMRELYEYTVRPLPHPKTGGRGPNGRTWNWRRQGGHKRHYRMLDLHRSEQGLEKSITEVVKAIVYDPNRSGNLALVAAGERKRYIIATVNMKVGDKIISSRELSESSIRAAEGDSYPVGSLAVGSVVNSLELLPGEGSHAAMAAGCQATIIRKTAQNVILRLPSKREVSVQPTCLATVGRVGNIAHNQRFIGKAGRNRWLGFKPRSGYYQKKTGRFGRKIKPPKSVKVYKKLSAKRDVMAKLPYHMYPESRLKEGRFYY